MSTLFLLIAKNSNLGLKNLETKATVKMDAEGLEKLIFKDVHFNMKVKLEKDNERERKRTNQICHTAQKICLIRQSWGESSD